MLHVGLGVRVRSVVCGLGSVRCGFGCRFRRCVVLASGLYLSGAQAQRDTRIL